MGKVYLVGAGCGALDLYTIKAIKCLKQADCVIYDSLVDEQILDICKDHCEKIYVGKRSHHHTMKQEDINQLLVDKAKQYHHVVRLKGGDVYVFGRGGEEGKELYKNHIDFEVVPGVSSATAGLAYAGIPITHRGLSGGFQVYTASLRQGSQREFDFSLMLDDYVTYIFLMGMSQLEMIIKGFLDAGKNPATPVAVLSQASLPTQQCITGMLSNIVELYQENPLPTPGIIVVGNVVKMREYLNFYERKPLFSKRILVTTVGEDHYLKEQLTDLGAYVDEVKCGSIQYLETDFTLEKGYLIFTSRHGVIGFMKNFLRLYHDVRKLSDMKMICIGRKTNEALNEYGLSSDMMPTVADSRCLNEELKSYLQDGKVYVVQGKNKSSIQYYDELICVYENKEVEIPATIQHYDYGFFTCASSVYRFSSGNQSIIDKFISIGAHTTHAIKTCYKKCDIIETSQANKQEMIEVVLRGDDNVL